NSSAGQWARTNETRRRSDAWPVIRAPPRARNAKVMAARLTARRSPASRPAMRDLLILSTAADKTQREKQNDRPGHGDQNAADIEPVHRAIPQLRADEAADDGADNADQGRHDESAGIAPGHDEFREGSGDEAEKDPDDDTHDSLPRALARKPSMSGPIADRKPDQLSPHDEGRLARPRISNRRMLSRANRNAPGRTSIEASSLLASSVRPARQRWLVK